jgi:hypothetical protein
MFNSKFIQFLQAIGLGTSYKHPRPTIYNIAKYMAKKAHLPNSIKLYGLDTVSTLVLYCDENSVCKSSRYWNAIPHCRNIVPKSNRKIIGRGKIDTLNTQIRDR